MSLLPVGVTVYIAAYVLATGALRASTYLHAELLLSCLRAPMMFYDTTPLGRIVNRFSKDIDVIDTIVPRNVEVWVKCTFHVLSTAFVISYSTPYILVIMLPLAVFYYVVQVPKNPVLRATPPDPEPNQGPYIIEMMHSYTLPM